MARVTLRPQAEADLQENLEYIALDSLAAADKWVDELGERMKLWATQPQMGRARDELAPGIRSLAFGRYVVFYTPLSDGIDVVRVMHGSRDIDNTFTP